MAGKKYVLLPTETITHINMFSNNDLIQILQHGITQKSADRQLNIVKQQKVNLTVVKPALKQDGLLVFNQQEINDIIANYTAQIEGEKIMKFIPSSGAATRMFKDLFIAMEHLAKNNSANELQYTVLTFFDKLPDFAFFETLKTCMANDGINIDVLLSEKNYLPILSYLLTEKGLNYGKLPKGLLLFHRYPLHVRTALEEHLVEAAGYTLEKNKIIHLHFTVSPEHIDLFKSHCQKAVPLYEKLFGVTYHIDFSTQQSSTDTIAFTVDNKPFRDKEGNLVFRPGGHGSLIENLNCIDADIVLIKNIDNVTLDKYKSDTIEYKKVLICFLLRIRKQVFTYLDMLDRKLSSLEEIKEIETFLRNTLFIYLEKEYDNLPLAQKLIYLYQILNSPIRVCGMVKREDEPGGGPFWVKDASGKLSLQIVETSEMDLSDEKQQENLEHSAFFNPVDLACSIKDYQDNPFNLADYIDHSRYFVSEKSYEGKTLKAIENPGLWNGAMSNWLTVFISVPLTTFTPVKTINDLLQKGHNDLQK
ncbi:MAG: DUF4301 family protein [Bacteroidales bacterium]|jgi:hypothetical protein|nr:DUF4301 family protein [Bacteroidales bacterium]